MIKSYTPILLLSLLAGCATDRQPEMPRVVESPGRTVDPVELPEVRTAEVVKAYPVGRYSDPNAPDVMHERHTVYRRVRSSDWNYRPSRQYALPLGPSVANSKPSRDFYVRTDAERINAQQKAHAEALLEQNRELARQIKSLAACRTCRH